MNYLLTLYADDTIHELELSRGNTVTIGTGENDTPRLDHRSIEPSHWLVTALENGIHVLSRTVMRVGGKDAINRVLSAGDAAELTEKLSMSVLEKQCDVDSAVSLSEQSEVTLGRHGANDVRMNGPLVSSAHAVLLRTEGGWAIRDLGSRNGTFVGGKAVKSSALKNLNKDAVVFMGGFKFFVRGDKLYFENTAGPVTFSPRLHCVDLRSAGVTESRYPFFQRSPRLEPKAGTLEVEILSPPSTGAKPSVSWLSVLLPPVMMILVMLGVSAITGNRMTLFYTVPMSGVSIVMAVVNYKSQIKKWEQNQRLAAEKYAEHLKEKDGEITAAETKYLLASAAPNPGPHECAAIAKERARGLWERSFGDEDFIVLRLGTGKISSNVEIKIPQAQLTLEEDPLLSEARKLKEKHKELTGVPVVHSFFSSTVTGLSGDRGSVKQAARVILMNVAAHHSYEDVKIVCVYPESEKNEWAWARWLPHVWNADRTERFVANSRARAHALLKDIAETLRHRRFEAAQDNAKRKTISPFYFLMLADKELTESCGEELLPESEGLGMTAVYAYGDIGLLPGECLSIVECGSPASLRSGRGVCVPFTPDRVTIHMLDAFARALAPVRLQSSRGASMPAGLTFLEGWGVRRVEDIDAPKLWRESRPTKSLAARIGVRENGDLFHFDVHEKKMGPHGLVAGTTGSGKSEALTTWLLSMALSFSPVDVNFFLIDFKGDGLAGVLKELPHVAGTVGNLSEASVIVRALRSLDGELKRRQHVFSDAGVKNIQSYQETFRAGKVSDPMAYLLIVIDEFAEMHTQFPELSDQFISVARTGRSLGIYLTLTMQSPGGIVKGQVESNLNFRIVLRTSGPGESREALGTSDAAAISKRTPGRAWVRSGEVYELVQTFYSAAPYNPVSGPTGPSTKIYITAESGERTLVYGKTIETNGKDGVVDDTEGHAVAEYVRETAKGEGGLRARPVWTRPLPEKVLLSSLLAGRGAFANGSWQRNEGFSVVAGLVDDPENQTQYPLFLDFIENGHYALYGAPSSGKTTFLQTALLSAALSYTPDQVRFLVLDFGTWGLKLFERLPHTLLVADANDAEKVKKTEEYLLSELAARKRQCAGQGVGSLRDYAEITGKSLPVILVAVDNMAALHAQCPDLADSLTDIAREGGNLGLHLILTAGSQGSFMYKIAQHLKASIALQLTDRSEYRGFVGGDGRQEPAKFPGRGFVKGPLEFQTALAAENVQHIRDLCDAMSAAWGGAKPAMRGALEEIDTASLAIAKEYAQIGIEKDSGPFDFVFADMNGCVISGAPRSGKTNLLGRIVRGLLEDEKTTVYLYEKGSELESLRGNGTLTATHDGAALDARISELLEEYYRRVGGGENPPRAALCVDDFVAAFRDISDSKVDALTTLILCGGDFGIYTYVTGDTAGLIEFRDKWVEPLVRCLEKDRAVAIGGRLADHRIFGDIYGGSGNDVRLPEHEARILRGGETRRVKLARFAPGAKDQGNA
ncbi:MAG: type VII secretion protein EssC [Synergistaceae bacterium]|jgi:S-DNA-T family DNA segregation ATPase FtsK/SpoIIIE|nr:type VII secretion protein EssC [Synergistaceae bacterium]